MRRARGSVSVLFIAAAVAVAVAGSLYFLKLRRVPAGKPEPVVVAYSPYESTALFWIAEDQGYFVQNGLALTLRKYPTGAGALDGLGKGEADVVVGTTEFPLVRAAFLKARVRAIAGISKSEFVHLVARKDRGIGKVTDLRGKRVGTTSGTIVEFYLGRFLELHGLGTQDVVLVDLKTPPEWLNAIADGEVDAVVAAQPHVKAIVDRLGDNGIAWPAQNDQPMHSLAIAAEAWLARHHDAAGRFLEALAEAEKFAARDPDASKAIVQKRLGLDPAYMETVWAQNQFLLSLDQSLILAMEDEARWMIEHGLTPEQQVPDFLEYLHEDDLGALKPGAINIIRGRREP
jgi:NitT/TauT family transport system substrate-binding protein